MKIFFSAIALLVLILTIIDKIRLRFRPDYKRNDGWVVSGLLISGIVIIIILLLAYFKADTKLYYKAIFPGFFLIIFFDMYRRRRQK
ncbi:MAG: hypothetical protein IPL55_06280 [Saprospiraceae bacterium]|nr:hypothetical protein [Saprospiraceae bacterium]